MRLGRFLLLTGLFVSLIMQVSAQTKEVWDVFAKTKFDAKYFEQYGEYIMYPSFTPETKALVGKEITLHGFYVPFAPEDGNYIILSRFPMSQCFFCGGSGPESVVEVNFAKGLPKLAIDDQITVRGKLKLNADDMDHVNFILTDAVIISK
jgi:hypothetical protein